MSLSPQAVSYLHRDQRLLELIQFCGALSVDQVRSLLFPFKTGYRKANDRLLTLYRSKQITRGRALSERSYVYYHGRPRQIDHVLGVNWVYVWIQRQPWSTLKSWKYTPDYGMVIPDAEAMLLDAVTGKKKAVFVEMDRDTAPMDKIALYNRFYDSRDFRGAEWAQGPDARFPEVLIVTISRTRARCIEGLIALENRNGIRFRVRLLEDIVKECKI